MKNKKSTERIIDIPTIRVISKKTSAIPEPTKTKAPKKERMKDGDQPPGTGRGGNLPPPQWDKGQSGNPGGRPKDPPGMKEMKLLTKVELVKVGNMIIEKTLRDMTAYAEDEDTPALHVMVASVVGRIIRTGDMNMLNALLDRLIGKVREEFIGSINSTGGSVSVGGRTLIALPANGREAKK